MLAKKQGLSLFQQGKIHQCYVDQFSSTVVKRGNLLLRMRRDYVGSNVV